MVRIKPTGVISITTDLGSADFVPEYGCLHATSLKGTYKNSSFTWTARVMPRGNATLIEASWHRRNSHVTAR